MHRFDSEAGDKHAGLWKLVAEPESIMMPAAASDDDETLPWNSPLETSKKSHDDVQWRAIDIASLVAGISVPSKARAGSADSGFCSQSSTPRQDDTETSALLLPKVVDAAANKPSAVYGTFAPEAAAAEVVPLHPTTLLASAALTPVYLILMLLPLLPFWIFAGFLTYVVATNPLAETHTPLLVLGALLPFNAVGTVAIVRFALAERERALQRGGKDDLEAGSTRSEDGSGGKKLWRPSMQFVLYGARRAGRRR